LAGAETAHAAFAHNIANVNTPNFHRTDVSFMDQLSEAAGMQGDGENLTLATTNPLDISAASEGFAPQVSVDDQSKMRQDGNNVDVDAEMAHLSKNADYSATGAQFLKNQYAMLRQVITEQ
jgi:flagellar basal-body rod protein FlgB